MNNLANRLLSPSAGLYTTGSDGAHSKQIRLSFLGALSAGLAHDYANTFQGILLRLACIKKKGEIRPADLASIERQLMHAAHRAEQLSKFVNGADTIGRFTLIDLREGLGDAIELIEWRQAQDIDGQQKYTIHCEFTDLQPILGPAGELVFLFVNLLMNGCEAMPHGGVITVNGSADESNVVVTIADQGSGIPYELLFAETAESKGIGWSTYQNVAGESQMTITKYEYVWAVLIFALVIRFWRFLRCCIQLADEHDGFMTFLATVAIAVLTYFLVRISDSQWGTARNQLLEAQQEFRFTQRAEVVVGNEYGISMELKQFGEKTKLVIYMRNDGHSPANDVVGKFAILFASADKPDTYQYSGLNPPAGLFDAGPTLGAGSPLVNYMDLPSANVKLVNDGTMVLRVVGRLSYFDKFASYCEPFGVIYLRDPPRFQTSFVPPATAVCDSSTPDAETFSVSGTGDTATASVRFAFRPGEFLFVIPPPGPIAQPTY